MRSRYGRAGCQRAVTATRLSSGFAGNVLAIDTFDGAPATTGNVTLNTISSTDPGVTLGTGSGSVTVAPGTALGLQWLDYQICETASQSNSDTATASLAVAVGVASNPVDLPARGRWSMLLLALLVLAFSVRRIVLRGSGPAH